MSSFHDPAPVARPKPSLLSIERVVALLTPLFAALAGFVVTLVAKIVPGTTLSKGEVTAVFITGATSAAAAALHWLTGRQKFVKLESDAEHVARLVGDEVRKVVPSFALADVESVMQAHAMQIIDAMGTALHAPPSAEEIAKKIVQELWPKPPQPGQTGPVS